MEILRINRVVATQKDLKFYREHGYPPKLKLMLLLGFRGLKYLFSKIIPGTTRNLFCVGTEDGKPYFTKTSSGNEPPFPAI